MQESQPGQPVSIGAVGSCRHVAGLTAQKRLAPCCDWLPHRDGKYVDAHTEGADETR